MIFDDWSGVSGVGKTDAASQDGARVQAPAVHAYVQRLRRASPQASPAEIVVRLEKRYLATVMASGAAVGSAAAFPGIGTIAAMSAVAGEIEPMVRAWSTGDQAKLDKLINGDIAR